MRYLQTLEMMKNRWAFGLSVGFHLVCFWVFNWGFMRDEATIAKTATKIEEPEPIEIRLVEKSISTHATAQGSQKYRNIKAGSQTKISLSNLIPKIGMKLLIGQSSGVQVNTGPLVSFGKDSGDLGKLVEASFFQDLYKKIDEKLVYPSILVERRLQGTVNVSLLITPEGSIDWSSVRINGGSKYLRLYIVRVLREVFLVPLDKRILRKAHLPIQVDLSMKFSISENSKGTNAELENYIMGQVLTFSRIGHRSVMEWKLGPLRGMFPIPHASVDILGTVDEVVNGDPLVRYLKGEEE